MLFASFLLAAGCRLDACGAHPHYWLGGDVNLGPHGGAERLTAVTSKLHGAGIVNLEGPIGEPSLGSSEQRLINGPGAPAALFDAGVRVAQVVNNHALDLSDAGLASTTRALEQAGVLAASEAPVTLGAVTVQSFDLTHGVPANLHERLSSSRPLFVTFHVTAEPLLLPEAQLEAAANVALDAGATVVAAQGTHALAKVEWRGDALVAYGLGNLAFDCDCTDEEDGLVLEVQLSPDGKLEDAWVVPVKAGLKGRPAALADDPAFTLTVLKNIGSSPLERAGVRARVLRH